MSRRNVRRVAVVGGGMSGVAAAYYLKRLGFEPEVLEADQALGGRAGSTSLGDKSIDIGGKNIGRRYRRFREFCENHGSPPFEYFGINSSTVRRGRLHTVDSQRKLASLAHVLTLTGPRDFGRLLKLGRLVRRKPSEGLLGGPEFSKLAEQRDHAPLSAWFGADTVEGLLRPITLRMNGAEPDEYYLGCLGTNLRMLLDSYDQLSLGMHDLLQRFAGSVPVSLGTRAVSLLWSGGRVVGVELECQGARERRTYDWVVLALPAPACAALLEGQAAADELRAVTYNPVTLVVARYSRPVFDGRVRAIVFGPDGPLSNAGAYGRDDLDLVRYTLSGRAARGLHETRSPEQILTLAEEQLRRFLPVQTAERLGYVHRYFRHGLCAYGPYYHRSLARLLAWERSTAGLSITGDYLRGASIEACFAAAEECAERLAARAAETEAAALDVGHATRSRRSATELSH